MRHLIQLYFSYVKASILSIITASAGFYFYAAIVTGEMSLSAIGVLLLITFLVLVTVISTFPLIISKGNDVLDKLKHEPKESRKSRVIAESKRTYIVALLFACIFITSTIILLGISGVFNSTSNIHTWIAFLTFVISAISTISTAILAWKNDRRSVREQELKITGLERQLEEAREKPALPISNENSK